MKKVLVLLTLVFALSFVAMAEEWTGYIADSNCAAKNGAKAAADGHAGCALNGGEILRIIRGEHPAIHVGEELGMAPGRLQPRDEPGG